MGQSIYQVDSFTDIAFGGNPAGVCLLTGPAPAEWMQKVAREMNNSETAFLNKEANGDYQLRWFTPKVEVDLCGHATLASAHILFQTGLLKSNEVARFHTKSGLLTASLQGEWIELNFPATPADPIAAPQGLAEALGCSITFAGKSIFDYLVEVPTETDVREMSPDMEWLSKLPVRGVIVTAKATTPGYDFVSRFFAPPVGIDEDPVTGSAHSCLTPYWNAKLNKTEMMAYQASDRGGVLKVILEGDRVRIGGQAVMIFHGELC